MRAPVVSDIDAVVPDSHPYTRIDADIRAAFGGSFVVLAIAVKDRKQDAIDFVKELKISYPIAFDPDAQVGTLYGAWGLPATYLIGPKGEGLARGWGPAEWYNQASRRLIQDLVDGKR